MDNAQRISFEIFVCNEPWFIGQSIDSRLLGGRDAEGYFDPKIEAAWRTWMRLRQAGADHGTAQS